MPKNVVNKITKTVSKTTKKMNLTYLLAVLILIGLITALLVIAMRNKEGFKKFVAFDSIWVSKGEKGADGAKGEDAKFEKKYIDENGNEVIEVFNNDEIEDELKNMFMDDMVKDGIIVKEEGEEGDKYYPTGTIYHKTYHSNKTNLITPTVISSRFVIRFPTPYIYKTTEFKGEYFNVNYKKKSKNSFVKITYTINLTGRNDYGNQFRIFGGNLNDNSKQISETHSMAGVWNNGWTEIVPKSVTITGIDTDNSKGNKTYFVKIGRIKDVDFTNDGAIKINGVLHKDYQNKKYNNAGYLNSSCTIEEIVLPKDTTTTLSNFI